MKLTWMRWWLGLLIADVVVIVQTNFQDGFGAPWRDLSESFYKHEEIRRVDDGDVVYLPSRMDIGTSTENPSEVQTVPESASEVLEQLPVNVRTLIDNAFKVSESPRDSGLIITREELLERLPVIMKLLQLVSGSEVPEGENGLYISKLNRFAALKKIKDYPCVLISCTRNGKSLDVEERTTAAARLLREAETVTAASMSMSPDQRRFLGILLSRVSRNIEEELSTIASSSTHEPVTEPSEKVVLAVPPVENSTSPLANTSLKVGTRQNNPSIDEIITGIVQLLGGNVRVSKPPAGFRLRPTASNNRRVTSSKRVNDRGPALFAITPTSVIQPSIEDAVSTSVVTSATENRVVISSSTSDEPTLISSLVTPSEVSTPSLINPTPSVNFVEVSESYLMTPVSSVRIRIFSTPVSLVKPVSIRLKPKSTTKINITPSKSIDVTPSSSITVEALPSVASSFSEEEIVTSTVTPSADKDIVYGKPVETEAVRGPGDIHPSKTVRPSDEEVSTVIGLGTLDKPLNQTFTLSPDAPTGRPYIVPVEIEEVRPFIGSYPGRPVPGRPGDFGVGGVRKPPPTKNNTYPFRPGHSGPPKPNRPYGYPDPNKVSTPRPSVRKPPAPYNRPAIRPRPNPPLVRIDTCIVGDDSTCDVQLNERCVTELGVSSCHCRPGLARTIPRGPCNPVISVSMAMKIDRIADRQITFNKNYLDTSSDDYRILEQETNLALNSLFTYTSFSRTFVGATINKFHPSNGGVIVNTTIQLEENESNKHPVVQRLLQQEILNAITSRNLNIGDSNLYLNSPPRQGPMVYDLNECELVTANDCSGNGVCQNTFGSFRCACKPGFMDKHPSENWKSGRICSVCSPTMCNNHGECVVKDGRRECKCRGNFIGTRCEIDGEVLGVALGASLAALVIIILTLVCLCVWNRRWKRDQHKAAITPQYAYTMSKKNNPAPGATHVRVSVEDRMRWAHIADAMGNIYVQQHDSLPALPSTSAPPALPPPPPPHSCPSSMKHIYATPSRLLLQKACEDNDRNRLYAHVRPKSRSSHLVPVQSNSGYYDLNEFPSLGSMHSRDPYGNAHYGNPNISKSTSYY